MRAHPDVLEIRWQIYAKEKKWEACREIARAITQIEPGRPSGWIHYAYSTRRATNGGLEAAKTVLLSANENFPQVPVIPYNLACYYCQLDDLKGAWDWLERAFDIGNPNLSLAALGFCHAIYFTNGGADGWREGCLRTGALTARTSARCGLAVSVTVKQPVTAQDDVIFNEPGRRSRAARGDGGDSLPRVHAERDTAMGRLCR
jgi:tetratricopeptide (TPR) repeat protein